MRFRFLALSGAVIAAAALIGAAAAPVPPAYPASPPGGVTDTYFGTTVADSYRWLENGSDPVVKTWAAAQTSLALGYIEPTPAFAAYKARIAELSRTSTERFRLVIRGSRLIYQRLTPPQQQPQLVVRDGLAGTERVRFDPASAAGHGPQPSIETVAVSPDGGKVAFTTQLAGSEDEAIHIVDTASGTLLPDTLPHAGGGTSPVALSWDGDGKGLLHTLWPQNADGSYANSGILLYHHVLAAIRRPIPTSSATGSRREPNTTLRRRSTAVRARPSSATATAFILREPTPLMFARAFGRRSFGAIKRARAMRGDDRIRRFFGFLRLARFWANR